MEHQSNYIEGRMSPSPLIAVKESIVCGFRAIQEFIVSNMDRFFYLHGKRVARHPFLHIFVCCAITALCGVGLIKFREENNVIKLWIPEDSSQRVNSDWMWENYPNERRFASMIFVADNVLVPEVIRTLYRVHKSIEHLETQDGDTWPDMCVRVPIVKPPSLSSVLFDDEEEGEDGESRRKRESEKSIIHQINLNDDIDELDQALFPDADILYSNRYASTFKADSSSEESFGATTVEALETTTLQAYEDYDTTTQNHPEEDEENRALHYSLNLYPDPYCKMVEKMPMACLEWSILELWAHDGVYDEVTDAEIENLTTEDIIYKINNFNKSGVFLSEKDFSDYLGEKTYDENGLIVGAKATIIRWFSKLNATAALLSPVSGRDEPVDKRTLDFEGEMIRVLLNTTDYPEGLESYPNVQRSFGDVSSSTILGDIWFLAAGFAIVLVYMTLMLGKFSWVENRILLSIAGIASIVMGVIVAYGLCSALGHFFGPMHNVLPFLLLGIGIDDMFVIVQSWETLSEKDKKEKSLEEKFGIVMTHSGVAITITSITDIVAFALGGTTILPALRSFCYYSSVGIFCIYWFVLTFFFSFMYFDQIRIEKRLNGILPCIKHKNENEKPCDKTVSDKAFDLYGKMIVTTPGKAFVIVTGLAVTGVAIWGNFLLEQKFVPAWFLPPESYLSKWFVANEKYFPFGGDRVTVWMYGLDCVNEFEKINNLALTLKNQTDIIDNVDAWTSEFLDYIQLESASLLPWNGDYEFFGYESYFYHKLTQFIFSPRGAKYLTRIKFEFDPWCGYSAPNIILSDITFTHRVFKGPTEHIPAMNRVKQIIADANITGKVFPLSQGYAAWETDEVISHELYRNLGLAILCIFTTTILLVGHFVCALLVVLMVLLSLVNVAGFIHFWGLTIDTVSCVNLIIAIGLCVDYSAHIGHRFLVERHGTKEDRARATLRNIGPAVLNGGLSTFIAFILLSNSTSHVFITFFKIFLLVVIFGLFFGLAFLPVTLSLIGPKPNLELQTDSETSSTVDGDRANSIQTGISSKSASQLDVQFTVSNDTQQ